MNHWSGSMKGMSKFYRLIWDWLILIPGIVAAILFIFPPNGSAAPAGRGARLFLWALTIAFPSAMGLMLASRVTPIRSAEWAWTLPGQRRILYVGSWQVLIGTVAFIAALHLVTHGSPFVASGIATLSFAVPIVITYGFHLMLGPVLAIFVIGGLVGAGDLFIAAVTQHGLVLGLCCFFAGFVLMQRSGRAGGYREAIFRDQKILSNYPARWMVIMGYAPNADAPFKEGYRKRGHLGWIQSAFLSNMSSLWPLVTAPLWNALYFVSMTYNFSFPIFVASPLMTNSTATAPLSPSLLYPMHRKTRAGVAVGMHVISLGLQIVIIAIALSVTMTLSPVGIDDNPARIYRLSDALPLLLAMMMWLPVIIWPRVAPSRNTALKYLSRSQISRMISLYLAPLVVFILLSLSTKHLYTLLTPHIGAGVALAALCVGAIVTHTFLVVVMRNRFYRYDL